MRILKLGTLAFVGLVLIGTAAPAWALDVGTHASSDCNRATGHVLVKAEATNREPDAPQNVLQVVVTELTFTGISDSATVAPGQTAHFVFDVGEGPRSTGAVLFTISYADGHGGARQITQNHSATPACGTSP